MALFNDDRSMRAELDKKESESTLPLLKQQETGTLESNTGACVWGNLEDGIAYLLTLSLDDALSVDVKERVKTERLVLTKELSIAGQRGAKGKMKELVEALEKHYLTVVDTALNAGAGRANLASFATQWREMLWACSEAKVISWAVKLNHVHILLRWQGDKSLAEQVEMWKNACKEVLWSSGFDAIQVSENKLAQFVDFMLSEGADETIALQYKVEELEARAESISYSHVTVLLQETVDLLNPQESKIIVDATLGGGGHTELLLERGATVIGIDQDPDARIAAAQRLARFGDRFRILAGNFRDVEKLLQHAGVGKVDGLLADIGVSSHQIDTPERGFSFRENGPLDMRMSPSIAQSAADLVNFASEAELARIFWEYGEERASRSLARAICQARAITHFETTLQLAQLAEKVIPRRSGHHPGTKAFQAFRIAVNDELGALNALLDASVRVLAPEGRLAIITFHSLEDRCVKRFLEERSKAEIDRPEWPASRPNPQYYFNLIQRKPQTASAGELALNPRSRSAKLRGAQRTLLSEQ